MAAVDVSCKLTVDAEVMSLQQRVRDSLSAGGRSRGSELGDGDAAVLFEGYLGGLNSSSYIFRVTKHCACCDYSFLEVVKKRAPLTELYRNIELTLGRSGGGGGSDMVLFFLRGEAADADRGEPEVVFVPSSATRTLEDFIMRGGVPWLPRAVYPVPEKAVYQLFLHENNPLIHYPI